MLTRMTETHRTIDVFVKHKLQATIVKHAITAYGEKFRQASEFKTRISV